MPSAAYTAPTQQTIPSHPHQPPPPEPGRTHSRASPPSPRCQRPAVLQSKSTSAARARPKLRADLAQRAARVQPMPLHRPPPPGGRGARVNDPAREKIDRNVLGRAGCGLHRRARRCLGAGAPAAAPIARDEWHRRHGGGLVRAEGRPFARDRAQLLRRDFNEEQGRLRSTGCAARIFKLADRGWEAGKGWREEV